MKQPAKAHDAVSLCVNGERAFLEVVNKPVWKHLFTDRLAMVHALAL